MCLCTEYVCIYVLRICMYLCTGYICIYVLDINVSKYTICIYTMYCLSMYLSLARV